MNPNPWRGRVGRRGRMKLYLKGDYTKTDFYEEFKEIAQKMWFKERKGIPLDFSYAWDEDLHLNLANCSSLNFFSSLSWSCQLT
ncbi:hypothetical protein V470_10850 [Streptococcus sp. VT 162]|nr:hypothetical protein V470_10850 [Streptococcus sp. VT 162]